MTPPPPFWNFSENSSVLVAIVFPNNVSTNQSMLGYAAPSSGYGAYSARSGEGVRNLTMKQRSKQTDPQVNKN